jgi:hypothetical protein
VVAGFTLTTDSSSVRCAHPPVLREDRLRPAPALTVSETKLITIDLPCTVSSSINVLHVNSQSDQ